MYVWVEMLDILLSTLLGNDKLFPKSSVAIYIPISIVGKFPWLYTFTNFTWYFQTFWLLFI